MAKKEINKPNQVDESQISLVIVMAMLGMEKNGKTLQIDF
jgi:hypothetical protein